MYALYRRWLFLSHQVVPPMLTLKLTLIQRLTQAVTLMVWSRMRCVAQL